MGRILHYDHSTVTGYRKKESGGYDKVFTEDFVHLRHQDPILLACRRNIKLAACDRFDVDTVIAFDRYVDDIIMNFVPYTASAAPEYEW